MSKNRFASEPYVEEKYVPIGPEYKDHDLPEPNEDRLDEIDPIEDIHTYINTVSMRRDIDAVFERLDLQSELNSGILRRGITYILENYGGMDSLDETVERPFNDEIVDEIKSKREEYGVEEWDEDGAKDLVAEYLDRNLDVVERRHDDHRDLDHFVRMMENYWLPIYDSQINANSMLE